MRLSDVKGDRVLDVVAALVEPISDIITDGEVAAIFKAPLASDDIGAAFAEKMKAAIPVIVKKHKEDVIEILAAIDGRPAGEYAESMTLAGLVKDVYELITDEDFLGFLASFVETQE